MASQSHGHEFEQLWEIGKDRGAWSAAIRGVTELDMTGKATEQ